MVYLIGENVLSQLQSNTGNTGLLQDLMLWKTSSGTTVKLLAINTGDI